MRNENCIWYLVLSIKYKKLKTQMANGKYHSVGADPCVRPSKGPCLPYLKPLIGSTHGSTPTSSLSASWRIAICDLSLFIVFEF